MRRRGGVFPGLCRVRLWHLPGPSICDKNVRVKSVMLGLTRLPGYQQRVCIVFGDCKNLAQEWRDLLLDTEDRIFAAGIAAAARRRCLAEAGTARAVYVRRVGYCEAAVMCMFSAVSATVILMHRARLW